MKTNDSPLTDTVINLRIDAELHSVLKARSSSSGRPMTTETLRLVRKGLAQEEALGARSENGFDLMLAFAVRGARGVIEELLHTTSAMELRQYILSVEAQSGRSA